MAGNKKYLDFSDALKLVKQGLKIARKGWNGKGMYVYYVPENSYKASTDIAKAQFGDMVPYEAYFAIKTTRNTVGTWVPSVSDLVAEDWYVETEED